MQRIRVQRKGRTLRYDPSPVLPLDARDPEVMRIKEAMRRHPSNANRAAADQR